MPAGLMKLLKMNKFDYNEHCRSVKLFWCATPGYITVNANNVEHNSVVKEHRMGSFLTVPSFVEVIVLDIRIHYNPL